MVVSVWLLVWCWLFISDMYCGYEWGTIVGKKLTAWFTALLNSGFGGVKLGVGARSNSDFNGTTQSILSTFPCSFHFYRESLIGLYVWDDFHFRWLKIWHYQDRDELNPYLKWRRSPSIHVWRYELSFNDFHFLFFASSRRLQAPFSTFNSTSVSFLLFYTLQLLKNFRKIFRFFSFICWPWWCQLVWPSSLCVIIYLLSVSLWAFKREVWGCCSSSTHLHHHFILVALGSSDRRESERKTGRNWKKRRSWR